MYSTYSNTTCHTPLDALSKEECLKYRYTYSNTLLSFWSPHMRISAMDLSVSTRRLLLASVTVWFLYNTEYKYLKYISKIKISYVCIKYNRKIYGKKIVYADCWNIEHITLRHESFFCYDYKEEYCYHVGKNIIGPTHLYFFVAYILQEIKTVSSCRKCIWWNISLEELVITQLRH